MHQQRNSGGGCGPSSGTKTWPCFSQTRSVHGLIKHRKTGGQGTTAPAEARPSSALCESQKTRQSRRPAATRSSQADARFCVISVRRGAGPHRKHKLSTGECRGEGDLRGVTAVSPGTLCIVCRGCSPANGEPCQKQLPPMSMAIASLQAGSRGPDFREAGPTARRGFWVV